MRSVKTDQTARMRRLICLSWSHRSCFRYYRYYMLLAQMLFHIIRSIFSYCTSLFGWRTNGPLKQTWPPKARATHTVSDRCFFFSRKILLYNDFLLWTEKASHSIPNCANAQGDLALDASAQFVSNVDLIVCECCTHGQMAHVMSLDFGSRCSEFKILWIIINMIFSSSIYEGSLHRAFH